jgi:hypothetical protein
MTQVPRVPIEIPLGRKSFLYNFALKPSNPLVKGKLIDEIFGVAFSSK